MPGHTSLLFCKWAQYFFQKLEIKARKFNNLLDNEENESTFRTRHIYMLY